MKVRFLIAMLAGVLMAGVASAQTTPQGQVPAGEATLGSVRLPRSVMADGKALKAGTYQVRLTAQAAAPAVAGQSMERWVEFVQGGKVAGREVVSIIPASEVKDLQPGPDAPASTRSGSKVEMLKGNEYLRVWINRGGVGYLIHMPPSAM
ncbi:MAG: hypothetical protein WC815_06010 [Vicinamibacterales bacterium]|jgi:hypothetical protein